MFYIEHTRSGGKGLTYDVEVLRDGSYVIRRNGRVLRRGLPDPYRSRGSGVWSSMKQAIARARNDIELLVCMEEEALGTREPGPIVRAGRRVMSLLT